MKTEGKRIIVPKTLEKSFREEIVGEEKDSSGRHILLTPTEAEEYQKRFGGENYHRIFFGLRLREALEQGYKISCKGYFETTHAPAIQYTALTVRNLLADDLDYSATWDLADLFTGTGQAAWAFAQVGFQVTTTELDEFTYQYAQENLELAGVSAQVTSLNMNTLDFLGAEKARGKHYAAIFLDPPWDGAFDYDLSKPFFLEYTNPNAEELIRKSIQIASVVALKTPQNIDKEQVRMLGEELNCQTTIQFQTMPGYEPKHNPTTVYFVKGGQSFAIERFTVSLNSVNRKTYS